MDAEPAVPSSPFPPIPAASARRASVRTRSLSIFISVVIHAGLIMALAAVVWTTVAPPLAGAGGAGVVGAKINLENAAVTSGGSSSAGENTAPRTVSPEHALVGSLAPILDGGSDASEPLQGLSSPQGTAAASGAGQAGEPSAIGGLGTLLGPSDAQPGNTPTALPGAASVTFGGLGAANVGSVVYVVDCSGPMVTSLPLVMEELERSVKRLTPAQRFGVVLFRRAGDDGVGAESFAPMLVRARPSVKELLHDWVTKIEPAGRSSPLAGLELALSLNPDAIFLLSRSIQRSGGNVWELGLEATMARLEQLNPVLPLTGGRRAVLIQTIQFLDEDPTGIMQAIGQRHGGGNGYRVVKRQQDLQADPHASKGAPIGAAAVDR